MFWPVSYVFVGLFLLILASKPEWISAELKKDLSKRPRHITVLKWCGTIAVIVGLLEVSARLLGII